MTSILRKLGMLPTEAKIELGPVQKIVIVRLPRERALNLIQIINYCMPHKSDEVDEIFDMRDQRMERTRPLFRSEREVAF